MELIELKEQRWASGKEAVCAIKDIALQQGKRACVGTRGGTFRRIICDSEPTGCTWFVCVSRSRTKTGAGDWHVTEASLEHLNCMGISRPTCHQLESNPVVLAALAADPSTPAHDLVAQLQNQSELTASEHVMYRAKQTVLAQIFSEDPNSIQHLPHFLSEFQTLNPGTFTEVQCDSKSRFRRAVVVLNPQWFLAGQGLYGVDAAHMKHRGYNGIQLILVSRDGNFNNHIAAVALAPLEDRDNYDWFFGRVVEHGFPLTTCPVFSDRHLGLVSAAKERQLFNLFCIRHLIGNMRSDKTVRLAVSQDAFVWQANAAKSEADFLEALDGLSKVNSAAATYLRAIPSEHWTLYRYYDTTPLYGWRTTNFVESEQARSLRLKPRMMLPFEYFKAYATILMGECYRRAEDCRKWVESGRVATPRAENKFQQQLKKSTQYKVTFSSDGVAFVANVEHPLKQRRVDTNPPSCSCSTWKQQKLPCRHPIAVLTAQGAKERALQLIGDCFKVATFAQTVGELVIPEDSTLMRDLKIKPAPHDHGRDESGHAGRREEKRAIRTNVEDAAQLGITKPRAVPQYRTDLASAMLEGPIRTTQ